jgi:hypothetical protein
VAGVTGVTGVSCTVGAMAGMGGAMGAVAGVVGAVIATAGVVRAMHPMPGLVGGTVGRGLGTGRLHLAMVAMVEAEADSHPLTRPRQGQEENGHEGRKTKAGTVSEHFGSTGSDGVPHPTGGARPEREARTPPAGEKVNREARPREVGMPPRRGEGKLPTSDRPRS